MISSAQDTTVHTDSVETRAIVTYTLGSPVNQQQPFTAVVDSLILSSGSRIATSSAPYVLGPIIISGSINQTTGQISYTSPDRNSCSTPESAAAAIAQESFPRISQRLTLGGSWADSSIYTLCRAGIPLLLRRTATYKIEALDSAGRATISRQSTLTLTGAAAQKDDTTAISGTGHSRSSFQLQPGQLVRVTGEQTLDLTIANRTRSQRFKQESKFELLPQQSR